ncbi:MAG: restriction endonuclease subunit S [Marinoscillum sp.]
MNYEHQFENLPDDWKLIKFGDYLDVQGGSQPPKSTFLNEPTEGYIRLLQIRDFGDKPVPTYVPKDLVTKFCSTDDIFVARYGASLGRILTGMEGAYNVALAKVIYDKKMFEKGFLFYMLQTPIFQTPLKMISRSAQNGFNKGDINPLLIPLAPIKQQKHIVAKIEELFSHIDAGIEALQKAKQLLKQYRKSVLKAAVTGELTKEWREANKDKLEPASKLLERILKERREKWEEQQLEQFKAKGKMPKNDKWKEKYKGPEDVVIDKLPDLPKEWIWARLDGIARIGSGMSVSKSRKLAEPIEVAYLRVANVQRGYLVLDKIKTMPIEKTKLADLKLQEWDVLYNEGGDIDKLGRGWIWENQVEPCITQNHVFRASPYIRRRNHSIFLSIWGNMFGQEYFISTGKQTTNLASINKGVLSAFPTPLPPIEEQETVIEIVEDYKASIDRLESEVSIQLVKAEQNKQSILAAAFSGELVEPLESDGSASDLLEKIKQQTEASATKEKPTRRRAPAKKIGDSMAKKAIIDVLKESEQALSAEKLFDLTGADGTSPDEVENFYVELKEALKDKNVIVEAVLEDGIKQGDLIAYKVGA